MGIIHTVKSSAKATVCRVAWISYAEIYKRIYVRPYNTFEAIKSIKRQTGRKPDHDKLDRSNVCM